MPHIGGIWYSHAMYAVVDKTRVSETIIAGIRSPYDIWNNPKLKGDSKQSPAYVLPNPQNPTEQAEFRKTLDRLIANPNLVVKQVHCGN